MGTASESEGLSVFLSYSHEDRSVARALSRELRSAGLDVWIDEGELKTGDSIILRIANALSEVEFVIALVSEHSVKSHWCNKELALAVNEGLSRGRVRVLPLRLGDVTMPDSLKDVLYLQMNSRSRVTKKLTSRLISDVRAHQREVQDRFKRRHRLKLLSDVSSIPMPMLKKLGATVIDELRIQTTDDWDYLNEARDLLVNDYSVPSVEILYAAALKDLKRKHEMGWAMSGLVMLLPITSRWIRKLLNHKNPLIVCRTVDYLQSETPYVSHQDLISTFEGIKDMGKWTALKSHITASCKDTKHPLPGELKNIFDQLDS